MGARPIRESSTVVVARDVLASELGSEYVLLNLKNGTYYGLEDVGGVIWKMLQRPVTVADICRAVAEMFEVDPDTCRRDVTSLVAELIANGLVEVTQPAAADEDVGDDS